MPPRAFVAVGLTVVLFSASCSDPAPAEDPHATELARLAKAVEALTESSEAMANELKRQGRQIDALRRRRAAPGHAGAAAPEGRGADGETGPADGAATAETGQPGGGELEEQPAGDEEVNELLETEAGRTAIRKAAEKELSRRQERERRTFVAYTIGVFAREAGLDEHQTQELQRIWKESLDDGVELRRKFRALEGLAEPEKKQRRAEAMQEMRDLGQRRDEKVREVLNEEQLELYEETNRDIIDSLHGGRRRPRDESSE